MPTVTGWGPDPERSRRFAIEVDCAPFAVVPDRIAERLSLAEGDEVDPAELADRVDRLESEAAMERALQLLAYRPRTREEIVRRLLREGFADERVGRLLARLEEAGLLDDDAFGAAFVRGRLGSRPEGIRLLAEALYRRGIPRERALPIIHRVLEEEGVSEQDLLERAGEKKMRSLGGKSPRVARRRLFEHLARRGFPLDEVKLWVDRSVAP